ncbi:MAG: hypothetical protein LWW97_09025 [Deltaproteobacteria bacterium]|nr:hypothetical protein [Deltaproteobacteria bacterium]
MDRNSGMLTDRQIHLSLLITIMVSFILLFLQYFVFDCPLRTISNSDIYQHMACILEISKGMIPPNNPITTSSAPDVHYGPYLVVLGYVYRFTQIDVITLLCIAGLINLPLFIFFSFQFIKEKLGKEVALFSIISMLYVWGIWGHYAGIYKIFISQNQFYPQGIAYTLLFASLCCLTRAERDRKYMLFAIILSVLLFTTHLLTGVLYLVLIFLLLLSDLYKTRTFNIKYHCFLICLPVLTFLLSLLWPFYSVLEAFQPHSVQQVSGTIGDIIIQVNSSTIIIPEKYSSNFLLSWVHIFTNYYHYGVMHYPVVGGLACFGLIELYHLVRKKRLFFPLWFIFCFLMVIGPISFSHRFFLFSLIPLHIGFGIILYKFFKENTSKNFIYLMIGILLLSVITTGVVEFALYYREPPPNYDFIFNNTEQDSVILSDIQTSWKIPALTGRKVIYGLHGCGFPENQSERKNALITFYDSNTTIEEQSNIIKKYNISYILVDHKIKQNIFSYPINYQDDQFTLYNCKRLNFYV